MKPPMPIKNQYFGALLFADFALISLSRVQPQVAQ